MKTKLAAYPKPKDAPRRRTKNHTMRKKTLGLRRLALKLDAVIRQQVFERDGYHCVRCGSVKALAPSHVYPKGKYPRMRFLVTNILTMCYACHIHWWHKHPLEAAEWFLKTYSERASHLRLLKDIAPKPDVRAILAEEVKDDYIFASGNYGKS